MEIAHWHMAKKSINNYWLNKKRMLNLENDSLERPSLPERRYVEPEDEELGNQNCVAKLSKSMKFVKFFDFSDV
uniref:Uncharacterized protein n=1 Tax=Heterorhabditis bacteriophora TaxID=37862 RepID=A0A1I7XRF8_HETBA